MCIHVCVCVPPSPSLFSYVSMRGSVIVKFMICANVNLKFHIYCAEYTKFNNTAYIGI